MRQSAMLRASEFSGAIFAILIYTLIGLHLAHALLRMPAWSAPQWVIDRFEYLAQALTLPVIGSLLVFMVFSALTTERAGTEYWHFWDSRRNTCAA